MNSKNGYKLYNSDNELLNIQACFDCLVCHEWKNQPWKSRLFCPVHCYACHYAGYDEDFSINYSKGLFLCYKCDKKIKLLGNPINLLKRELGINYLS